MNSIDKENLADAIYTWTNNPQDRKSLGDYDVNSLADFFATWMRENRYEKRTEW